MAQARSGTVCLWEREREVAATERAVADLCSDRVSRGTVLVFRGEAGIGKTALIAQVRRTAEWHGCTVWSARGGETLGSVPFNVLRQLLQPALLQLLPGEAREYLGDWYDIAGPALGIAEPGARRADPQSVREGLVVAVRRLARREFPLVLLVDDAHWADPETLRWLAAFTEHLDDLPVLVAVGHRGEEVTDEVRELLRAVDATAGGRIRDLKALTPDAVTGLTRGALGPHADAPFCREVWAVTGGNPYEAVELLAKARDVRLDPVESTASRLRTLGAAARGVGVVARLDELGSDATRLAWATAVLAPGVPLGRAAELVGLSLRDAAHCTELLRSARILAPPEPVPDRNGGNTRNVHGTADRKNGRNTTEGNGTARSRSGPDGQGPGEQLEFVHPLIASAVYDSVPAALRTAMHGIAAQILTESGLGAAAVAQHLLLVHPDDDEELVEQLRQAAREHLAVGAPDAARRCLERALREPPRPGTRPSLLYELGCATLLTAPATTVGHLRKALADPLLDGELRVEAVVRLSHALLHNNQLDEAVRVVAEESERHPSGPVRMRLQSVRFMWEGLHPGEARLPGSSEQLAGLADACTGRDNSERVLLILRGFDAMMRGESAPEVLEYCERALVDGRFAPELGWTDPEWGFEPLMMLAISYGYTDRLDRAENFFRDALRSFEAAGWSGGHVALAHAFMGNVLRRRGRLREAEDSLRESLRMAERVGRGLPLYWASVCNLIDTMLARGQVAEAWAVAEKHGFGPPYPTTIMLPDYRSVRGRLLLATGRLKEGVAELEAAEQEAATAGRHNPVVAFWAGDLARAVAADDPTRAAALAADVRRRSERLGTGTALGEALRLEAALADDKAEAVRLAARAVAHLESSPSAYEHAVARVEYGIAAGSAAELRHGLRLARTCGADGLAARAQEILATGRGPG